MASGGRRNRSGPQRQEGSARSDRRGYSLQALPHRHDGFAPNPPDDFDREENELWYKAWTWPQAYAWAQPGFEYLREPLAAWVRLTVRARDAEQPVSVNQHIHRYADQVGLTTAGLAELGWKISPPDNSAEDNDAAVPQAGSNVVPMSSRDRVKRGRAANG